MTQQIFNNKRVTWESRAKQIALIVISFAFVAIALLTTEKYSSFSFLVIIILFGGGGIFTLIRLLNSKNLFVTHSSELGRIILAEQIKTRKEEFGFFTYDATGFYFDEQNGAVHYNWIDINTVFCYKEDWITTDEICLDIFTSDNNCIKLTEDIPGWYQFNKKLIENFPIISGNWEGDIVYPPFETNLKLLYDKLGRTENQAKAECYMT
ncbi:hypothetical protein [Mucilaginibacter segetis]|uniref:Uncharacterized protein n=1 Tax=Mucilaginibacter segetis TaxID=2793071 RepID=A0A934UNN6_9SPHI|nr:hypothetical protein [Mucilaginibacter segetis]MBK0380604.1 hypothetical protein [Mucilaginibacter segetis]